MSKVNLKARISRHSRILKDSIKNVSPFRSFYYRMKYNIVVLIVIFLFPIYPLLASFFYENSVYDFYRWNIDEDTILSYSDYTDSDFSSDISKDSYISINKILDSDRDLSWVNEIIDYSVKSWESFSSIAYKFGITKETIYWVNEFSSKKVLQAWETIKILPVSWLTHKVKDWDTIDSISKKYKVEKEKIISQNSISDESKLEKWLVLVIPGAVKEKPKPIVKKVTKKINYNKPATYYSFVDWWKSQYVQTDWIYKLVKRKPQHVFYWGNCTRFIAQYKNVNWWWNAKDWIKNAKAKGHSTWDKPWVWAIVVFYGRWYNPRYGHVWIVVDVKQNNIIVKDMNYRRLNEVTVRKIPKSDRSIIWYIYVD